eukprot:gene14258-biopygen21625
MRTAARARSRRANDTRPAANYALNVTGTARGEPSWTQRT